MNELELLERIQRGENLHTEFKREDAQSDDIAASLVAFANTDGGQLIFGVTDDGQIVGVPDPDRLMQRVDQIAYQNCEPPITVLQETVRTGRGTVVVVHIPKGDQRPYRTNRGDFFIRTSSGRRRASRQELLRLFQSVESLYYDETLVLRADLADLDLDHFKRFFARAYPDQALSEENLLPVLQNMKLVGQHQHRWVPTVASLLCFGKDPQRFLPGAEIRAARLPGTTLAAEPGDAKSIGGNLFDMLEDAMRFLHIHLPVVHRIRGLEPERHPMIPDEALRELLVNALVHRDYTITAPVRVLLFDDRLEIRTPGQLPNTVTVEAILLGAAHVLRNPTIYLMFYRAGLVTHLGSGVLRAKQALERSGKRLQMQQSETEFISTILWEQDGGLP